MVKRLAADPAPGCPRRNDDAGHTEPGANRHTVHKFIFGPSRRHERWNVVNRVLGDEGFDGAAHEYAAELARGPTLAHAATKQVLRDYLEGGVEMANERVPEVAGALFASEDLQGAVRSFLDQGPGRASFRGR